MELQCCNLDIAVIHVGCQKRTLVYFVQCLLYIRGGGGLCYCLYYSRSDTFHKAVKRNSHLLWFCITLSDQLKGCMGGKKP